ncbi:hypothetical protein F4819DRAFT_313194 [Hypoxylon fuscum]|nr:hypothetical protein F4819DRAFT_313194 [Hypoxylon fuscum]
MLRQLRTWVKPAFLRPTVHYRQFWTRQKLNFPNYAPHPGPYFYPPPKSPGSRLKDMAIGSAFTVGGYLAYLAYDLRRFARKLKEAEEHIRQTKAVETDFQRNIAGARRADDQDYLRELTFAYARHLMAIGGWSEDGPLPSLPDGEESQGKGSIPEEDTLMFINDPDSGNGWRAIEIAINAEFDDILRLAIREDDSDAKEGAFNELLRRVNHQAARWIRRGLLREDDVLIVHFTVRDREFGFSYVPKPSH